MRMPTDQTTRAPALSADDRRASLIEATLPLLLRHGSGVTTRQIADAAGVAEGTIFRVFDSKDDVIEATLRQGLNLEPFLADLEAVDTDQHLRDLLVDLVERFQNRFTGVFTLMASVGAHRFPEGAGYRDQGLRAAVEARTIALLEPHADQLRLPAAEVLRLLRLLTLSGTHPHLTEGRILTAETIVDVILDGTRKEAAR